MVSPLRVTLADLRGRVAKLGRAGFAFYLDVSYGRPRINSTDERHISPRLSTGMLSLWLEGFETAIELLEQRAEERARKEREGKQ